MDRFWNDAGGPIEQTGRGCENKNRDLSCAARGGSISANAGEGGKHVEDRYVQDGARAAGVFLSIGVLRFEVTDENCIGNGSRRVFI